MPQQIINLGATGSGAGGDSARTAFEKAIANFAELYIAALPGTAAQKQAARDMFGLGTAATRAVQTGLTDTTAGAVATTGGARFAVLANYGAYYSSSAGKNIDTLVGGESGLFSNSNPGTFPPGYGSFVYIETQQTYTNSAKKQEAWDYSNTPGPSGRRAFRVCSNSGAWSEWRVYYHTGNILGTVSQSGGVPTGAIIERGSNANGEYVRYADGTQICWGNNIFNTAISGAWMGGVRSGANVQAFPASFSVRPFVAATPHEIASCFGAITGNVSTSSLNLILTAITSQAAQDRAVFWMAVGRWY